MTCPATLHPVNFLMRIHATIIVHIAILCSPLNINKTFKKQYSYVVTMEEAIAIYYYIMVNAFSEVATI